MKTDDDTIRRLAEGEDPWEIDPEHGCADPLTGYFPTQLIDDYIARHTERRFTEDEPLVVIAGEGEQEVEYVRADVYDVIVSALDAAVDTVAGRYPDAGPALMRATDLMVRVHEQRRRLQP